MKVVVWFFRLFILAAVLGIGLGVYAFGIEPSWLQIRKFEVGLDHLPAGFDGYRLVFVSDFHVDGRTSADYLHRVIEAINRQDPDLVLLGGDFVTEDPVAHREIIIQALEQINSRDGVLAVLGNHDYWQGAPEIRAILSEAGVRELANEVYLVENENGRLHIAGLDNVWEGHDRLDFVTEQIPVGAAAVLLVHEPDVARQVAAAGKFGLQLSGHSHGGQINLPIVGPPILPYLGRNYPAGMGQVDDLQVYTTRGVGAIAPRARFNCRPEVTVIDLVPGSSGPPTG